MVSTKNLPQPIAPVKPQQNVRIMRSKSATVYSQKENEKPGNMKIDLVANPKVNLNYNLLSYWHMKELFQI